ncbi:alpha/beta fold hydrolase [Jannaschia sp. R86511]|uniref:alpha/beta fold hydrolase n=1 Tax=Jannaschia sp. R86511 TaxID=3093853 RepID=UPI0036D27417
MVHGLASNARMWDACAEALARAGVTCVAVDLRGHGRTAVSQAGRAGPHGTPTAAADVSALVDVLRADGTLPGPVVLAGQSWGGNVVLTAAASGARVDALALVDGGWLRFDRDEPFERLWARLAPPTWDGTTWDELTARLRPVLDGWGPHAVPAVLANLTTRPDGSVRNVLAPQAHEHILRSMYDDDPRPSYPRVRVPVLLAPAGGGPASALVDEAVAALPDAVLRRYDDAHHDLHLQHPARLAADLLDLLDRARARPVHAPQRHTDDTTDGTTDDESEDR